MKHDKEVMVRIIHEDEYTYQNLWTWMRDVFSALLIIAGIRKVDTRR
jgi:hypothetical protein